MIQTNKNVHMNFSLSRITAANFDKNCKPNAYKQYIHRLDVAVSDRIFTLFQLDLNKSHLLTLKG